MKRLPIPAIAGVLAFSFCAPGCNSSGSPPANGDATTRSDLTAVTVVEPQSVELTQTSIQPAVVHAYQSADVHAKVSGYVESFAKDVGDPVKSGDALASLSIPEMDKELERQKQVVRQREAEEKRAAARVKLARADFTAGEAALAEASSKLDGFTADLAADQSEFERVTELVASRTLADRLLDEVRERRDSARARLKGAESAVSTAKANVAVARASVRAAKADQSAAESATEVERRRLEELETMADYAVLVAPFDGVVTSRTIDRGDLVRNAQTTEPSGLPLFTVEDTSRVRVRVAVPEADAAWIDSDDRPGDGTGDDVTLRFKALGGEPIHGTVTRHAHRLDDATRSLEVEVVLDNDGRLLPGMFGEATITLKKKPGAVVLPATAVRYDESGRSFVYLVGTGDKVEVLDVTTGLDDGKRIEITSELPNGARVVDAIIGRLQPGQQVRVN